MLKGLYTAMVTPFNSMVIDYEVFANLVEHQCVAGVAGIVIGGTTGEAPTLLEDEFLKLLEIAKSCAKGRVKIIAGCGGNATSSVIEKVRKAEACGVDAVMIVTPYYNKPTQVGVYKHFEAIHNSSSIPIILYDIPGRAVVGVADSTLRKLFELERVVGLKDCSGDITRPVTFSTSYGHKSLFSGDDPTALAYYASGGVGLISVASNVFPEFMVMLCRKLQEGDFASAKPLQAKIIELCKALFCETNPVPVKLIMEYLGMIKSSEVRLPLYTASDESVKFITDTVRRLQFDYASI